MEVGRCEEKRERRKEEEILSDTWPSAKGTTTTQSFLETLFLFFLVLLSHCAHTQKHSHTLAWGQTPQTVKGLKHSLFISSKTNGLQTISLLSSLGTAGSLNQNADGNHTHEAF